MQVLYFAWLRERIGAASEEIDPGGAATARDLIARLAALDDQHAAAFADISAVRVAVDQVMGDLDTGIAGAREVAFFPPVTGG
ncbi:MAG TPA: MoaD/ThiS family protein [Thermohalobaculum sp.]|nr:MoaD/ThiS family protein [Thermohalobaculum sp.]